MSWVCACCGEVHDELPSVAFHAPDAWFNAPEEVRESEFNLTSDSCIWKDQHFFVRCSLNLPIVGMKRNLSFGIWSTLSKASFDQYLNHWEDPERTRLGPMFGWLANQVPDFPDTSHLKVNVHPLEPDFRPLLEIEPGHHPLARYFREGVTLDWAAFYVHKHLGI
jgi:hypothetical protein